MAWTQVQTKPYGEHTSGPSGSGGQVSAASFTLTFTSTATSGNLLIAGWYSEGDTVNTQAITTPTGWTLLVADTVAPKVYTTAMYYKISDGTETAVTFALAYAAIGAGEFREYSGVDTSSPVDKFANNTRFAAADASLGTVNYTSATDLPDFQDGLHIAWFAARSGSSSKASLDTAYSNTVGRNLHGATLGTESRNGTYTGVTTCFSMTERTSGTGGDPGHQQRVSGGSTNANRGPGIVIFKASGAASNSPMAATSGTGSNRTITSSEVSTAAATIVVNKPTGTASGDLLIAWIWWLTSAGVGSETMTTPATGWTKWGSTFNKDTFDNDTAGGTAYAAEVYYRVADGTEGGSWTWTISASSRPRGGIVCAFIGPGFTGTTWQGVTPNADAHRQLQGTAYISAAKQQYSGRGSWTYRPLSNTLSGNDGMIGVLSIFQVSAPDETLIGFSSSSTNWIQAAGTGWTSLGGTNSAKMHVRYGPGLAGGDHWGWWHWAEGSDSSDSWVMH